MEGEAYFKPSMELWRVRQDISEQIKTKDILLENGRSIEIHKSSGKVMLNFR